MNLGDQLAELTVIYSQRPTEVPLSSYHPALD